MAKMVGTICGSLFSVQQIHKKSSNCAFNNENKKGLEIMINGISVNIGH